MGRQKLILPVCWAGQGCQPEKSGKGRKSLFPSLKMRSYMPRENKWSPNCSHEIDV
jgi:hypothetical protein